MEAKWDEMRQMLTLPEHGIPRAEWERRFRDELRRLADTCDGVADGELQTWPEDDGDQFPDWLTREYLVAEEGDEADAILSYRTDRMEVAE